ncbi:PAS domain-containing sensor histidine kinase [Ktedonobacter racemifer]|uniref:histidine kinase n=1 Tax=Ktedonobacter racemifer DSM 44963 TaxID=485913 RepID=D6TE85_KTERA|nr:PAS domain S-box protein [Ktedonobacter racemifer]EFH88458.1 PAS/PAC sensor signal transduction histidine kinase [Ktedonobacter racemifer DSM 44963]
MKNPQDPNLHPEKQGAMSGELPIQPDSTALMVSFLLTLNILAAFLDLSPDALIVVDTTGMIVLVNTQLEMLFGYGHDELIGQTIECLLPEHLRAAHVAKRTHYMQAARPRLIGAGLDLVGRRKDGSQFPVEISLRPIRIEHTLHVMGAVRDITAQREVERERMRILQRLRQQDKLISLAHDAILVRDAENRILSWNEGAEHLYRWTAQEVTGKVSHTLLQTRFLISQEAVDQTLEQHGQWQGELIHTCRDGTQVIVESRQVLVRDEQGAPSAILEINRDVTERRRLEHLEQEARADMDARLHVLQSILDRLPNGVFLVQGPQLRLLMANDAAAALWGAEWPRGQPQEEFLQQQGIHLFNANGQPLPMDDLTGARAMASGEPVLYRQLGIRRPDGTRLPVVVDAIPFTNLSLLPRLPQEMTPALPSAERVVLVVYQDVSALKEAETLKDQFISLATHELRTPLTIVAGYADRLLIRAARGKEHGLDEWQREKVQEMKQASWQLASLTEDLLDVTRMQAGQFALERRSTDLVDLTRKVIQRLQATTDKHQLDVQAAPPQLWATVDTFRIEQVLSNLLSNAIKYSPGGGPIEVMLEEHAETHEARFRIRDQGMGIPRAQQAHLFGRFVRAENARAAGIRGTGLGLYLCRELIERHGGHIDFESEEGVGSTFFFSLPCHEPAPR